jgi:hypothetical protein
MRTGFLFVIAVIGRYGRGDLDPMLQMAEKVVIVRDDRRLALMVNGGIRF